MILFNATTQQNEEAVCTVDTANEIIATFADGNFCKFPAGMTMEEVTAQAAAIQAASSGQEVITPEMQAAAAEAAAAAQTLADQLNASNTMPEGDQTNAPTEQPGASPDAPTNT
jgi:hypothetical protein